MSADLKIDGLVAPGYEEVRAALAAHPSGGSALTVLRDGTPVVELREGWRDAARTRSWTADTLVDVYSVGKPVIALAVLILVERGLIGLDDPIARHWPSFTTKASVRQLLTHTAGLPVFPVPRPTSAFSDWKLLCADLAAAEPLWAPGTTAAEHALTYGHLLGELVRRVDGRTPARFVAQEIAEPWGLDFGFGFGPTDIARCAELEYDRPDWPERSVGTPGSVRARAVQNPHGTRDLAVVNSVAWRSAQVPAVNLHATATAIARMYAGLLAGGTLDGHRLLSPSLVATMTSAQFEGEDLFVEQRVVWGLSVQIEPDGTWGMGGLGGNAGWADPATGHSIAFVTRQLGDFRRVDAIEAALPRR